MRAPTVDGNRLGARWLRADAGLVGFIVVTALVGTVAVHSFPVVTWLPQSLSLESASAVISVFSAIGATAAAVLWAVVGRYACDGRAAWGGAAFGVYGLIVVPATINEFTSGAVAPIAAAVGVVAPATVAVMLFIASRPAIQGAPRGSADMIGICIAVAAVAVGLAVVAPQTALALSAWVPARWLVVALWAFAGVRIARYAVSQGDLPAFRAGLGVILLAFSDGDHMYGWLHPMPVRGLAFDAVRMLAVAAVLSGAAQLVVHGLRGIRRARAEHLQSLHLAELGLERLAVREHELRNGIAGIAGATAALNGQIDDEDEACLRRVLAAEMARIDALLNPPAREQTSTIAPRAGGRPLVQTLDGVPQGAPA